MPSVSTGSNVEIQAIQSSLLMSRDTGLDISDREHVHLCIVDILTTPVGSRVMRREYGSQVFQLIDRPITSTLVAQLYYYVVDAIRKWEPRFKVSKVSANLTQFSAGKIALTMEGYYLIGGRRIPATLSDVTLNYAKQQSAPEQYN